jgi:hypothetical protein
MRIMNMMIVMTARSRRTTTRKPKSQVNPNFDAERSPYS